MNPFRLALGTLSILPVRAPATVDRRVAGWAMALAPLVGALIAVPLWLASRGLVDRWSPLLVAVLWVGGLALLTRAIHLDGLADTADGLGSRRPRAVALEIMRKGDVGPFGVTTLVLVLMVQVAAAAQLLALHREGATLLAMAVVVSRFALPWACSRRVPAARHEGLGNAVAGSVTALQLLCSTVLTVGLFGILMALLGETPVRVLAVGASGLVAGVAMAWWCVRRLGGITGDVLGACVEVAFTAALVTMTLA